MAWARQRVRSRGVNVLLVDDEVALRARADDEDVPREREEPGPLGREPGELEIGEERAGPLVEVARDVRHDRLAEDGEHRLVADLGRGGRGELVGVEDERELA